VRRLSLGLFLIAAASSVLLISDWKQRRASTGHLPRVAILQHASQSIIDEGVRGILDALAGNGFSDRKTVLLSRFNAENDMATANAIARELTGGQFDLVITATTVSLQSVAAANKDARVKHVFGLVSDPFGAGVGISRENPLDHPKYLTGIGTMQPVRETFEIARRLYPDLKTVATPWNPAEANSQAQVKLARTVSKDLGIDLLEATVENSSGVLEAANSLVSRGAQAIWLGGDVTVLVAIDSVVAAAKRGRIPVFTSIPGNAPKGALFDLGANYYEIGRLTGSLAAQVLKGAGPSTIPVRNILPEKVMVNQTVLAGLKDSWRLPQDLLARADTVIDASGTHNKAAAVAQPNKKWNVQIIELNNVLDVEECEQGILKGFEEAKLVKGRHFDVKVRNAQGDMATLNGLVDAAVADGADLLVTLSTPTLQTAIQRSQGKVPIVFTYVANAFIAGAGTSNEDHLPYVTGVPLVSAAGEMIAIIRQVLPSARRIGTLFVPSEVNMVFMKDELVRIAAKSGLEVEALGVATSSEVPDAALALMSRNVDALCQIPGNLTVASFGGIAQAAMRKRMPVFAFQNSQAKQGAVVVLARDYSDAGREAGKIAARVMRGESPANIPFLPLAKTTLVVNKAAARALGIDIPAALLAKATEVIKE
jgi:ABC-type uncharacterized transport system substrate-binding protein